MRRSEAPRLPLPPSLALSSRSLSLRNHDEVKGGSKSELRNGNVYGSRASAYNNNDDDKLCKNNAPLMPESSVKYPAEKPKSDFPDLSLFGYIYTLTHALKAHRSDGALFWGGTSTL